MPWKKWADGRHAAQLSAALKNKYLRQCDAEVN
jgi:hypothetical protein